MHAYDYTGRMTAPFVQHCQTLTYQQTIAGIARDSFAHIRQHTTVFQHNGERRAEPQHVTLQEKRERSLHSGPPLQVCTLGI